MATEKLLPQNVEAEAALLGSLLIDPEAITQVASFLKPDDFYRESHRTIYQGAVDLYETGGPADFITLCDELGRRGKLDEVGGTAFVGSLANQVPTSRNALHYARIVQRTSGLRRLIHMAGQIAGVAYNEPDLDAAMEQAEKLLLAVADATGAEYHGPRDLAYVAAKYVDDLPMLVEAQRNGSGLSGVPTGLTDLDRLTGGLHATDLTILGARPGVGKTALLLSIAIYMARKGYRVLFFSQEMAELQMAQRALAIVSEVDAQRIRLATLTDLEVRQVQDRAEDIPAGCVLVEDASAVTVGRIRSTAKLLAMQGQPVDVIMVDYLQIMGEPAEGEGGYRAERAAEGRLRQIVTANTRGLKATAKALRLPVIAAAQLNRGSAKEPAMTDLKEAGAIEEAADVIWLLDREELRDPETTRKHIADLSVPKHRNGPVGKLCLYYQAALTLYRTLNLFDTDGAPISTLPAETLAGLPPSLAAILADDGQGD